MTTRSVYIIAEAGVNHNGSIDMALALIDAAAAAGADAVKFQTFKADKLVSRHAPKAEYQTKTTGAEESQYDMIRKLELGFDAHRTLMDHAQEKGIAFLSTPFDVESLALLTRDLGMDVVKIPSGEITNAPFLLEIARVAKKVILSTGMSTLADVEAALGVLAFGFTQGGSDSRPSRKAFAEAFCSDAGQQALRDRVTLLHCTTEYPAPMGEINLRAMDALKAAFSLAVGYSDHTEGIHVPVAAVARGACLIEKHFTLDRNLPGPDHKASLEPGELKQMVASIRDIECALGDGIKRPTAAEQKNVVVARKSLVASQPVTAGQRFSVDNLACKRPGSGISPFDYWTMLEKTAGKSYAEDELIDE